MWALQDQQWIENRNIKLLQTLLHSSQRNTVATVAETSVDAWNHKCHIIKSGQSFDRKICKISGPFPFINLILSSLSTENSLMDINAPICLQ